MKTISLAAALALVAIQATAATLLTFDGTVTSEAYGPEPSPFAAPADSVTVSVIFDDTVPNNGGGNLGDFESVLYVDALLAVTFDVFDAGGGLLTSFDPGINPAMSLGYRPSTGASGWKLTSFYQPGGGANPYFAIDIEFTGIDMFNSTELSQITAGRLQLADPGAQGRFETELFDQIGIGGFTFDIDPASTEITRDVPPPSPVPAPPAILAMLTGLYGLRVLRRKKQRNASKRPVVAAGCHNLRSRKWAS